MKHTISILVENHAGALSRITGLFSRRGFNIDSLAVGETEDGAMSSRVTIVADGDDHTVEQIEKQLNKLIDVLKVRSFPAEEILSRELQLIKIKASPAQRNEILTICDIMGAKIIDLSPDSMTVEISDVTAHLERFAELIKPYGIKEIVRTGVIAIQKGGETIK